MPERDLVAKGTEHPGRQTLVQCIGNRRADDRGKQIGIDQDADRGGGVEQGAALGRNAGGASQDRVPNRRRNGGLAGCHDLGDV